MGSSHFFKSILFLLLKTIIAYSMAKSHDAAVSTFFDQKQICNVGARIDLGCATERPGVSRLLACVVECEDDDQCIGASIDPVGNTCLHHSDIEEGCSALKECEQTAAADTRSDYWERKSCLHGTWDNESNGGSGACVCFYDTFGDRCDQYPATCNKGRPGRHTALIDPDGDMLDPIFITCDARFHLMAANTGSGAFFNRSFEEYRHGFWPGRNDYWAGLDNMYKLNKAGFTKLAIYARFNRQYGNGLVYRTYYNWIMQDEHSGYAFTFSSTANSQEGTVPNSFMGDCLGPAKNTPFTTWDHSSGGAENCASMVGAGWWYSSCDVGSRCNVLGSGLGDNGQWVATPILQRFKVEGVDAHTYQGDIEHFGMHIEKP